MSILILFLTCNFWYQFKSQNISKTQLSDIVLFHKDPDNLTRCYSFTLVSIKEKDTPSSFWPKFSPSICQITKTFFENANLHFLGFDSLSRRITVTETAQKFYPTIIAIQPIFQGSFLELRKWWVQIINKSACYRSYKLVEIW